MVDDQLKDLYGVELSAEMVSIITDRILPLVRKWQTRPLHVVYSTTQAVRPRIRLSSRPL